MARIMVVSDSDSVLDELEASLGSIASRLFRVSSGQEVRGVVEEHEPDLAILDMQIGNMGGMAICSDLRLEESGGRLPHVKVLMLVDRRADVFLAKRSGAEGFLLKPLNAIKLKRAVTLILQGERFEDESRRPYDNTSVLA